MARAILRPVRRFSEQKLIPGFIVADVVVGAQLDKTSVAAFLRKCELLSHLRKIPQFLPMLIADGFTPEALRECRSSGIITTRPETLFGQDVAHALGDLLQTLSDAAAVAAANPDRIEGASFAASPLSKDLQAICAEPCSNW